jgi:hypothetical protein
MDIGKLYFIKDEFYSKFENCGLLGNKETIGNSKHGRPCCYLFSFSKEEKNIYWMIPISSKVEKYKQQYRHSLEKYHMCDNISFGYILGEERAFLPQNLFPITEKYIDNIYIDKSTSLPITVPPDLMAELNKKARKKIRYNQRGQILGMSDTMKIYNELIKEIEATESSNE